MQCAGNSAADMSQMNNQHQPDETCHSLYKLGRHCLNVCMGVQAVEAQVLENLSEQTTAEQSAFKTAQDIRSLRKQGMPKLLYMLCCAGTQLPCFPKVFSSCR